MQTARAAGSSSPTWPFCRANAFSRNEVWPYGASIEPTSPDVKKKRWSVLDMVGERQLQMRKHSQFGIFEKIAETQHSCVVRPTSGLLPTMRKSAGKRVAPETSGAI